MISIAVFILMARLVSSDENCILPPDKIDRLNYKASQFIKNGEIVRVKCSSDGIIPLICHQGLFLLSSYGNMITVNINTFCGQSLNLFF